MGQKSSKQTFQEGAEKYPAKNPATIREQRIINQFTQTLGRKEEQFKRVESFFSYYNPDKTSPWQENAGPSASIEKQDIPPALPPKNKNLTSTEGLNDVPPAPIEVKSEPLRLPRKEIKENMGRNTPNFNEHQQGPSNFRNDLNAVPPVPIKVESKFQQGTSRLNVSHFILIDKNPDEELLACTTDEVKNYVDEGQSAVSSSQSIDLKKKVEQKEKNQQIAQTQEQEEYEASQQF